MRYSDLKPRQRSGFSMGIVGFVLIMTRESAEGLAKTAGPASQAMVSLVFGVIGPLLLLIGGYNIIMGKNDQPRS